MDTSFEVRLPHTKLVDLQLSLSSWISMKLCMKEELESHASNIIQPGKHLWDVCLHYFQEHAEHTTTVNSAKLPGQIYFGGQPLSPPGMGSQLFPQIL